VTTGEVASALEDDVCTDLFVLHSIELVEVSAAVFEGRNGVKYIEREWRPHSSRLRPTQYEYMIAGLAQSAKAGGQSD
jgi:hypothetical protein